MADRLGAFSRRTFLKGSALLAAAAGATLVVGCEDGSTLKNNEAKQHAILEKRGLAGEHALVDLRDVPGFQIKGSFSGGFLFYDGSIDGESKRFLEFAWKTNTDEPEIIISQVPLDIVKFREIEEIERPKVEFRYDMKKILDAGSCNAWDETGCGRTHDSDIPNDFVKAGNVNIVLITMTPDQFKAFRAEK